MSYKITHLTILLFLIVITPLMGQNLVTNPGFENRNPNPGGCSAPCTGFNCQFCCEGCAPPNGFSQVPSIPNPSEVGHVLDWSSNGGSSDFVFRGGTRGGAVPMGSGLFADFFTASTSTQEVRTGDGAGGIIIYNSPTRDDQREYLITELSSPLVVGQQYGVEFYALLSNNSRQHTIELGAYFSNGIVPLQLGTLPAESSLQTLDNSITSFDVQASSSVSDNVNWTQVCGVFTATTPATHLYIGNIKNGSNTVLNAIAPVGVSSWEGAYYYIDDVRVEAFTGSAAAYCNRSIILSNELLEFEGKVMRNKNILTWKTTKNTTVDFFIVEGLQNDKFVALDKIYATTYHESTEELNIYRYKHENRENLTSYYRIKQVDEEGSIEYSKVIALTNENDLGKGITLYPNPSTNKLFLNIKDDVPGIISIVYVDVLGVRVLEEKINVSEGQNTYELLQFETLPKGIYLVKVLNESGEILRKQHKIIKK